MRTATLLGLIMLRATVGAGCAIPLEPTRTSFVATARIGSHGPLRFLVDTATSITVISTDLAKQLGVRPSASTTALSTTGPMEVQRAVLDEVRIGNVTSSSLPVLIVTLPHFQSHGRIDGILGMNFVSGRSLLLDTRRRCLDLDVARDALRGGTEIETEEVAGRVALKVHSLNFILDSAASFTVLMSPQAAKMALRGDHFELTSAAGRQRVPSATIPLLRIGKVVLRDLPAAIVAGSDAREDALLPITIFSTIYLDASRKFAVINSSPSPASGRRATRTQRRKGCASVLNTTRSKSSASGA